MLDVHPPSHSIGGVRDFLIHLLTITVGLLIALGLEAAVEAAHHRHLRHEAEVNVRKELSDDKADLQIFLGAVGQEQHSLKDMLDFAQARQLHQPAQLKVKTFGLELATLQDASWRSASATGALSYMDYAEVKRFAAAYGLQEQFLTLQTGTLNSFLQLQSYGIFSTAPEAVDEVTARNAAREIQMSIASLEAAREVATALIKQYDEALKEHE